MNNLATSLPLDTHGQQPETLFRFLATVYGDELARLIFALHGMPSPEIDGDSPLSVAA